MKPQAEALFYCLIVPIVCVLFVFVGVTACSPAINKMIAKDVIDVGIMKCIEENPGADKQMLKEICKWADELQPLIDELLASRKKGLEKLAHGKMGTGADEADAAADAWVPPVVDAGPDTGPVPWDASSDATPYSKKKK